MQGRHFFKKTIADLERLFEQNPDSSEIQQQILEELNHRSTKRAGSLAKRIVEAQKSTNRQRAASTKNSLNKPPEQQANIGLDKHAQTHNPIPPPSMPVLPIDSAFSNSLQNVLLAWTALEVLSPQSFKKPEDLVSGERNRLFRIQGENLPWLSDQEKSRPNQKLYYQIILGSIEMEPAVTSLLAVYSDQRIERPQAAGSAILATIIVDKNGLPVTENGLAISSFAWGLPVALSGNLQKLGQWSEVEKSLLKGLETRIVQEEKEPEPLTYQRLFSAYQWLIQELGLKTEQCKPPELILRTYQYYKNSEAPEGLLL
jgi:hypothetical protein